jgi:hypothetical protein
LSEDGALFDARFDDGGPFRDTPESGGISLESALHDFGPAAFDDLIPRVRALARLLDAAHDSGAVHGALHPSNIIVFDESTSVIKGANAAAPYAAPEVLAGSAPTAVSDQFSFAAITYEWMFGRPITGAVHRSIDVKAMPGVSRVAISKAFSRALSVEPDDRFASCEEFCNALAAASDPELPLAFDGDNGEDDLDPVGPFVPEQAAPNIDDVKIVAEETNLTAAQPDFDAIDAIVPANSPAEAGRPTASDVRSWNSAAAPSSSEAARFGGSALILAAIVGAVFGFAAGYMARPRALQSGPPATFANAPGSANDIATAKPAPPAAAPTKSEIPKPAANASKVAETPKPVAKATGRLLVRSSPTGATVTVDGVERGVTPLALRELDFGTHNVTVARRGSVSESRRVVITSGRPSRSLDVRLSAQPAAAPRPSTPASIGKPAASAGALNVDSRPTGASVTINGKASGKTPLTIDLPPGDYQILMTLPGFRNFTTTVRVVAGERVRAAASLTAQEQE